MYRNVPDSHIAILQAVCNQPDHRISVQALESLDPLHALERAACLLDAGYLCVADVDTARRQEGDLSIVSSTVTAYEITVLGMDFLKDHHDLTESFAKLQEDYSRSLNKIQVLEAQSATGSKRQENRQSLFSLVKSVLEALFAAVMGHFNH